jgi:hypothetical protein
MLAVNAISPILAFDTLIIATNRQFFKVSGDYISCLTADTAQTKATTHPITDHPASIVTANIAPAWW